MLEEAIIVKKIEERKDHVFDQYWVVFDKDQSSDDDFSNAIKLAEKKVSRWLIVIRLLNSGSYYISIFIKGKSIVSDMRKCSQRFLALLIKNERAL